jgi:hypothetical protein
LTPLNNFHQFRPTFNHVDKERQSRSIRQRGAMAGDEEKAKGLSTEPIVWKKIDQIQNITDSRSNAEK